MLNKTSKYAIKAVIYLGIHSSKTHKILTRDMYTEIKVSESYLAKILQELSRHGIISSAKGRNGGFYLSEENINHTLMDVVRTIEGDDAVDSCILGIHQCDMNNPCPLHHKVGRSKADFNAMLTRTRLKDLISGIGTTEVYFPE
jgi:Rrf2 family protein